MIKKDKSTYEKQGNAYISKLEELNKDSKNKFDDIPKINVP